VDIKTITGAVGAIIAIASLFVFQGQLIERVENLESQKAPNIKPLEQDIAVMKAEIAVLNAKVAEMKARSDNPLQQ
tara:strand:- start:539 stop:766 length:228 start_codon:yes stop_codon:yes gene_type:complete